MHVMAVLPAGVRSAVVTVVSSPALGLVPDGAFFLTESRAS